VTVRFLRRVYGVGAEPDPRFTLANERTFLAWVRTSLALSAGGVALVALDVPMAGQLRLAAALVLVTLGLLVPVQAWFRWASTERALRLSRPLPAFSTSPLAVAGLVVVGVLLVVGLAVG
jgi:putative membrane protein